MAGLFKILVVGLVVIAAVTWCEGDEAVQGAEPADGTATKGTQAQPQNKFREFVTRHRVFWSTQGSARHGNCTWYLVNDLNEASVRFEVGYHHDGARECSSIYKRRYFGGNDTVFDVADVFGIASFLRIHYSTETCAVVQDVEWSQTKDHNSVSCKIADGHLDLFPTKSCCYTNDTQQLATSPMARWMGEVPSPHYCSRLSYTIYVIDSLKDNVPKDCIKKYEELKTGRD
uniref:Lipocalin n=1 Tax=Rhipicephalus zambeziensis TaxID=60191 RepID=A0A224YGY8_9ACAR